MLDLKRCCKELPNGPFNMWVNNCREYVDQSFRDYLRHISDCLDLPFPEVEPLEYYKGRLEGMLWFALVSDIIDEQEFEKMFEQFRELLDTYNCPELYRLKPW